MALVLRSHHVDRVCGAFGKVFSLKVGVAEMIDGVWVASIAHIRFVVIGRPIVSPWLAEAPQRGVDLGGGGNCVR